MIGQPPNIEIRLSRGNREVLQIFVPPAALRWLDEHGMGLEHVAEALSGSSLEKVAALGGDPPPEPAEVPIELREGDGSPRSPGTVHLEAWLKGHPGNHTMRHIVEDIYGVTETEADAMLYERRGAKQHKVGTRFYNKFSNDLHGAVEAMRVDGWTVTPPTGRGTGQERILWSVQAPTTAEAVPA